MLFALEFLLLLSSAYVVSALPSWAGAYSPRPQVSIGNLVPGASFIEALGEGISFDKYVPKYLSVDAPGKASPSGLPGAAVIHTNPSPPLFFINNQQLWQVTNQTSILRVNVLNVTDVDTEPAPLKLDLGEKAQGISGGEWRWSGTRLFYDLGPLSNAGVYFTCQTSTGAKGVYMSLDPMPPPDGCKFTTLHSFVHR